MPAAACAADGAAPVEGVAPAPAVTTNEGDERVVAVKYLTVDEVAEILRCAPKTVREMVARGELPGAKKFGRRILIPSSAVLPPDEAVGPD